MCVDEYLYMNNLSHIWTVMNVASARVVKLGE